MRPALIFGLRAAALCVGLAPIVRPCSILDHAGIGQVKTKEQPCSCPSEADLSGRRLRVVEKAPENRQITLWKSYSVST